MVKSILLAHDGMMRSHIAEDLESDGYFVMQYDSANKAIEDIENGLQYDVLVTDLSFEESKNQSLRARLSPQTETISGLDILIISKKVNPTKPVISYSSLFPKRGKYKFDAHVDSFDTESYDHLLRVLKGIE